MSEYKTIDKLDTYQNHVTDLVQNHEHSHRAAYRNGVNAVKQHLKKFEPNTLFDPSKHIKMYKSVFTDAAFDTYAEAAKDFFDKFEPESKEDLENLVRIYSNHTKNSIEYTLQEIEDVPLELQPDAFHERNKQNMNATRANLYNAIQDIVDKDNTLVDEITQKYKLAEDPNWDLYKDRFDKRKAIEWHQSKTKKKAQEKTLEQLFQ